MRKVHTHIAGHLYIEWYRLCNQLFLHLVSDRKWNICRDNVIDTVLTISHSVILML